MLVAMAKGVATLVKPSGKVYALDPDVVSINALKEEVTGTAIEHFIGDITKETKLKSDSVEMDYISSVEHQMEGFIREVKRILKSEGRLVIFEIVKRNTLLWK